MFVYNDVYLFTERLRLTALEDHTTWTKMSETVQSKKTRAAVKEGGLSFVPAVDYMTYFCQRALKMNDVCGLQKKAAALFYLRHITFSTTLPMLCFCAPASSLGTTRRRESCPGVLW